MDNKHYVYIYLDQRKPGKWIYKDNVFDFEPFYVGKGKGQRDIAHLFPVHLKKKSLKNNKILKILSETGELPLHLRVFTNLSDSEAQKIEIDMIKHFGRIQLRNGVLCNMTDGGDKGGTQITKYIISVRKPVYQYKLDGVFVRKWESGNQVEEFGIANRTHINEAIKRGGTTAGFIWLKKYGGAKIKPRRKQACLDNVKYINIKMIDKQSLRTIKEFPYLTDAILSIISLGESNAGKETIRNRLVECIKRFPDVKKSAYGFLWDATKIN